MTYEEIVLREQKRRTQEDRQRRLERNGQPDDEKEPIPGLEPRKAKATLDLAATQCMPCRGTAMSGQ